MRSDRDGTQRALFWGLLLLVTALLFCWARETAFAERGYVAIGGEWMLWLLPVVVWCGFDTGREMRACGLRDNGPPRGVFSTGGHFFLLVGADGELLRVL